MNGPEPVDKPAHTTWVDPHGERGLTGACTCGWSKAHQRLAVVERAIARHLSKVSA